MKLWNKVSKTNLYNSYWSSFIEIYFMLSEVSLHVFKPIFSLLISRPLKTS